MPNAGRIGRVANTREIVVPGTSYLVAYRIREDMIHVLAIMHAARQWPETL
jgi:toxin ParE1/3/4